MQVVKMVFGSHLFGTNTADSDRDYKGVFLPDARDILLQNVKDVHDNSSNPNVANQAGDVDVVWYSLQRFLSMAAQGQTDAVDMLFAPASAYVGEPHPIWHEVVANRHRLLTRKIAAFVGYCRKQANTYSVKGPRLAAARGARDLMAAAMERYGQGARVEAAAEEIEAFVAAHDFAELVDKPAKGGGRIRHLMVCGRNAQYPQQLANAYQTFATLVDNYGKRARAAEDAGGKDWKAMMHALRIAGEGIELLETGRVILPRPDAEELKAIRRGETDWDALGTELDARLARLETLIETSTAVPDKPDHDLIEELVLRAYRGVVTGEAAA